MRTESEVGSESGDSEEGTYDEKYLLPAPMSRREQDWGERKKKDGNAQVFSPLTEGKELTCQVNIGKIKVKTLTDSGASVSMISRVIYDHLKTRKD